MRVSVKVTPKAKIKQIKWDKKLRQLFVYLHSAPADGKANQELIAFLAKSFHLSKSSISIVRGEKSRLKELEIKGLDDETLLKFFQENNDSSGR